MYRCYVTAYNLTIKGSMMRTSVKYNITSKTGNEFTTLVALFTPLKCSAANVAVVTGAVLAVVGHVTL